MHFSISELLLSFFVSNISHHTGVTCWGDTPVGFSAGPQPFITNVLVSIWWHGNLLPTGHEESFLCPGCLVVSPLVWIPYPVSLQDAADRTWSKHFFVKHSSESENTHNIQWKLPNHCNFSENPNHIRHTQSSVTCPLGKMIKFVIMIPYKWQTEGEPATQVICAAPKRVSFFLEMFKDQEFNNILSDLWCIQCLMFLLFQTEPSNLSHKPGRSPVNNVCSDLTKKNIQFGSMFCTCLPEIGSSVFCFGPWIKQ